MKTLHRIRLVVLLLLISIADAFGQIDLDCKGRDLHALYLVCPDTGYFRMDSVDSNPSDLIFLAPNYYTTVGICISNNLDTMTGQATMYSILLNDTYQYWDGTNWVNTFHSPGSNDAVNPGGTPDYIFNLDAIGNTVYRYDGSGDGTVLISNLNTIYNSVYDVATDNQGNFYLFYTDSGRITSYTSSGVPIDTFTTTGFAAGVHPGFAILGDRMYAISNVDTGLYEGIKTGNTINFSLIKHLPFRVIDIATCPEAGNPLSVFQNPAVLHWEVFPNPAHDEIFLQSDLKNNFNVQIINATGEIIIHEKNQKQLDVSHLAQGIYFLRIQDEKNVLVKKFVKQ